MSGKVIKQISLSAVTQQARDDDRTRPNKHGFMKGRSYLTNLISFFDIVSHLVDKKKAVDVAYLEFSKAFNTVSHCVLEKLAACGLDRYTLGWVGNWLEARPE